MLIALIVRVLTAALANKDSPEMGHLVKVQANAVIIALNTP